MNLKLQNHHAYKLEIPEELEWIYSERLYLEVMPRASAEFLVGGAFRDFCGGLLPAFGAGLEPATELERFYVTTDIVEIRHISEAE